MEKKQSSRLLSLDVLRGITIAGMIMVNNPGSWSYVYAPLGHAQWHGLTPTDLVFPFFMFIMGISTYISLRKFNFEFNKPTLLKILKRTVVIFLIGLGLGWLSLSFRTYHDLSGAELGFFERFFRAITNFEQIRILGVMQRLAITYGATALIAILIKHKYIPYIIVTTLVGYFLLLLFGNGFEFSEDNIISVFDRAILGVNHMYKDSGLAIDPEGLLSTVPAICHVLIGFCCGERLLSTKDNYERITRLFIIGAILTFLGFLLSYGCPINKKIWSPTFVLATCGLAATLLALLIWIIDIKGHKKWSVFFESFGVNPLFIYVAAGVFSVILGSTLITYDGNAISLKGFIYNICLQPYLGNYFGSLIFALLFVGFNWVIGNILYKKKIYIKI
ncbi:putative acyltransferase [Dysgonomonas sp. PFB1-18]|uniref:acyltransferase family protein n=1 Tax=unclassified Dysgonomonas TaxID=2630389 RepID=UPI00247326D0|nr:MULTISPECIES: heparan-alpha-glucosaminide N-acetyltransferase domain-containing protein [unclassified Dysgonomonas]MDH6308719.1 putative acyltransferase [Dysgonomonas sp. PF1-14]MDH6338584.1 putative acyltransferase [Dysgonomonas sp. PF1-16]MDH6379968.1 putative acyltransferase [Dysgonomonas sp. PFB1-18]MDH6397412.1 putative acyltransferase [Dysgonomonas sp. PF1-23]